jgi:hypothetical protein
MLRLPLLAIIVLSVFMLTVADGAEPTTSSSIDGTDSMQFKSVNIGHRKLRYLCRGSSAPAVIAEGGPGFSFSEVFARPKPIGWQIVFMNLSYVVWRLRNDPEGRWTRPGLPTRRCVTALTNSCCGWRGMLWFPV